MALLFPPPPPPGLRPTSADVTGEPLAVDLDRLAPGRLNRRAEIAVPPEEAELPFEAVPHVTEGETLGEHVGGYGGQWRGSPDVP